MKFIFVSMDLEMVTIDSKCFSFKHFGYELCDELQIAEHLKEQDYNAKILFI